MTTTTGFKLVNGGQLRLFTRFATEDAASYEDIDFIGKSEWWRVRSAPYVTADNYVQFTAISLSDGRVEHFSLEAEAAFAVREGNVL